MNRRQLESLGHELTSFLESMLDGVGRADRRASLSSYTLGLLLDGERKSIQPMAARLVDDASGTEAMRQRLQEAVTISPWSDESLFARLALKVERELPGIEALIIDDTGVPKKGRHSVGVARQYAGCLGRTDNCQVATSLHLASERGSVCVGYRLYLPEEWTDDRARCAKAGVPEEVQFRTKWQISLLQLEAARRWGVRDHVVLADAGYGDSIEFRESLDTLGYEYVVGITGTGVVWGPGTGPIAPSARPKLRSRPHLRYQDGPHPPSTAANLALSLGLAACRTVTWREGSRGRQTSRFGAVRIRTAHRHRQGSPPGNEQWLLYQWPPGETAPTKYWLSNLAEALPLREMVRLAKLRWRVERDYQEMKGELGLDHFEGRTWRGFHHHAALCALAHAFLALRRALFPPEDHPMDHREGTQALAAGPAPLARHMSPLSPTG